MVGSTIRDAVDTLEALGFKVNAGIEDGDLPLGFRYWDVYKVRATNPKRTRTGPIRPHPAHWPDWSSV